eukprot:2423423-Prymnesium_polylepis.1
MGVRALPFERVAMNNSNTTTTCDMCMWHVVHVHGHGHVHVHGHGHGHVPVHGHVHVHVPVTCGAIVLHSAAHKCSVNTRVSQAHVDRTCARHCGVQGRRSAVGGVASVGEDVGMLDARGEDVGRVGDEKAVGEDCEELDALDQLQPDANRFGCAVVPAVLGWMVP